ncbi:pilin N-terminal domain-containing protein [Enterococcus sp. DIV0170]|uniref:pilin N-terminal domain-containing protein n=1 Tax=Enterococcus sp. DIV0170 TaxID=2774642 RepID=UPI003F200CC6
MGKRISFIFCLLLGICCFGMMGFAADGQEEQVELWIHTWSEDGKKVEGTDKLFFDVYDLTAWREEHGGDEKEDKEHLLNTYATKEAMENFVKEEQLEKWNQSELGVDGSGNVSFDVPRFSNGKDAAYLILASGETGSYHMLPIVLYLPQKHPEIDEEAKRLLIYGKYQDISTPSPTTTTSTTESKEDTPSDSPRSSTLSGSDRTGKNYPSTNDLVRNFTVLGLLLVVIGLLGFKKIQKKK